MGTKGKSVIELHSEIEAKKQELSELEASFKKEFDNVIKSYFEDVVPSSLRVSKNAFLENIKFVPLIKDGVLDWMAEGINTTIVDGMIKRGFKGTLSSSELGKIPLEWRSATIQGVIEELKPKFEIAPRYYEGSDMSSHGYVLAGSLDKVALVWRKAATAYINRGQSVSAKSGLELLFSKHYTVEEKAEKLSKLKEIIKKETDESLRDNLQSLCSSFERTFSIKCCVISSGGRLSAKTIESKAEIIDLFFSKQARQDLLSKLNSVASTVSKKSLKL